MDRWTGSRLVGEVDTSLDYLTDMSHSPAAFVDPALTRVDGENAPRLIVLAESLALETSVAGLSRRLAAALTAVDDVLAAGVLRHDAERRLFRVCGGWSASCPASGAIDLEISDVRDATDRPVMLDMRTQRGSELHGLLVDAGARGYVDVPMRTPDKLLGLLFVATKSPPPAPEDLLALTSRVARLATPSLWSCLVHELVGRGDRRRDVLIELSRLINASLELGGVLSAALNAMRKLGEEYVIAIDLLSKDGLAYRRYRVGPREAPATDASAAFPPAPLAGGALQAVVERRAAYQSDDLRERCVYDDDHALRDEQMRRYVATPLVARGRLLGALLVATPEPHPVLRIDQWLFENVAVQLALAIDNAAKHEEVQKLSDRLKEQNVYLREEIQSEHDFGEIIGSSAAIRHVMRNIARVAPTDSNVLITGETGVGKELVARAIHAGGARAAQPMVKVNCAAIPEGTVESELFGHERGAFTSAVERRIGRFELARDGTLFLDEVGELPLGVQAKLLRVLQDGEFERVGGSKTLSTNARIIAATNRDLMREAELGRFRRDLYYRLNVFPIAVPPLRERPGDIPMLVEAFVVQLARRMGRRIEAIDPAFLADLCARPWPGNVRELRHEIERALILTDGPRLTGSAPAPAAPAATNGDWAPPAAPPRGAPLASGAPLHATATRATWCATLDEVEAAHIRDVLVHTNGVIEGPRGAARVLGLTPSTLRFRMKRLGVPRHASASGAADSAPAG